MVDGLSSEWVGCLRRNLQIGSSLVVFPAARSLRALPNGLRSPIILNHHPTSLDDMAVRVLRNTIGETTGAMAGLA